MHLFGLSLLFVLTTMLFIENASTVEDYTRFAKSRRRLREILDPARIKSELGSAISFGKRGRDQINLSRREKILMLLLRNYPQGLSPEWLLREIKTNPAFTKTMNMGMSTPNDNNQSAMMEYLNPGETMSIF